MDHRVDLFKAENLCRVVYKNITQWGLDLYYSHKGIEYEPLVYLGSYHPQFVMPHPAIATGATYKQLAYIGHLVGMDTEERSRWYEVAREIPLSYSHAGHIIEEIEDSQHVADEIERELLSIT